MDTATYADHASTLEPRQYQIYLIERSRFGLVSGAVPGLELQTSLLSWLTTANIALEAGLMERPDAVLSARLGLSYGSWQYALLQLEHTTPRSVQTDLTASIRRDRGWISAGSGLTLMKDTRLCEYACVSAPRHTWVVPLRVSWNGDGERWGAGASAYGQVWGAFYPVEVHQWMIPALPVYSGGAFPLNVAHLYRYAIPALPALISGATPSTEHLATLETHTRLSVSRFQIEAGGMLVFIVDSPPIPLPFLRIGWSVTSG